MFIPSINFLTLIELKPQNRCLLFENIEKHLYDDITQNNIDLDERSLLKLKALLILIKNLCYNLIILKELTFVVKIVNFLN